MKSYYFALLTALVWGIVPVFEKMAITRLSPQAGIFVRCLAVSSGALVIFSFKPQILSELSHTPARNILLIIFGGFTANFLGQLLFYNALKTGDVSCVTPVAGAYPLITFLMGVLILGESLTLIKALGMGLILLGVFLLK